MHARNNAELTYSHILAERIEALPGVLRAQTLLVDDAPLTDYFVDHHHIPRLSCTTRQFLCHMNGTSILISGMTTRDNKTGIEMGSVAYIDGNMVLQLPQSDAELELSWRIVSAVYQDLTMPSTPRRTQRTNYANLPTYSSTARYWV
jgi:hypothetical protein